MHTPLPSLRRLKSTKWSRLAPLLLLSGGLAPLLPQAAYAQVAGAHTVSGKVTSANGEGIPGVTVVVKGTTTGTTTDVNGSYTISVPDDNSVLVLSSIGYTKQEVTVGNRTSINQGLEAENQALTEVKVIGYGTQQHREQTSGAVVTIMLDEPARPVPPASPPAPGWLRSFFHRLTQPFRHG